MYSTWASLFQIYILVKYLLSSFCHTHLQIDECYIYELKLILYNASFVRWTKQVIVLENPTSETLELIPTVSNTNNFSLERDNERPLLLRPHSSIDVPIHFMPSTLGHGDHMAKVIFYSEQVIQLNLYIEVNEGSTEIWPLYRGDLYIEVEPILKLWGLDLKAKQFVFDQQVLSNTEE